MRGPQIAVLRIALPGLFQSIVQGLMDVRVEGESVALFHPCQPDSSLSRLTRVLLVQFTALGIKNLQLFEDGPGAGAEGCLTAGRVGGLNKLAQRQAALLDLLPKTEQGWQGRGSHIQGSPHTLLARVDPFPKR
jgi:hypothetical protein